MLRFFRRERQWLKWILLLGIIALGFTTVMLFVDTPTGLAGPGGQDVAVVAGESIGLQEFRRQYQQLFETYDQMYDVRNQDPNLIRQMNIPQQALNQLISQLAIAYEAEQLGLMVTDEELAATIARLPVFQENGQFIGTQRYTSVLRANNLTPRDFEQQLKLDLIRNKFQNVLTDGIRATEEEIRQDFLDRTQEVRVQYVVFETGEAVGEVTEEKLKEFFEANSEDYRYPERRRVSFVLVHADATEVEVTEEQIQAAMGDAQTDENVRARHILVSTRDQLTEEEARKKAEDLLARLREGADFEELAREHSDDPGSAAQGGDLGFFGRGKMVPEFERVAFSQREGQISDLVQTAFGFHIIQTLEKTADARRPMAELQARQRAAAAAASQVAGQILDQVKAGKTLEEAAQEAGQEVRESQPFGIDGSIPGLPVGPDFNQRVFQVEEGGLLESPYMGASGAVVARVDEILPPRIPNFEEVRAKVEEDYTEDTGDENAREAAYQFRKEAMGSSFEEAASEAGLEVRETDFFKKGDDINEDLKFSPNVHDAAFTMKDGDVSPPIRVTDHYVVFEVIERSEIDEEQYEFEKAEIEERLTQQKRNEFFSAYVQNIVAKLQEEERISINQDLVQEVAQY